MTGSGFVSHDHISHITGSFLAHVFKPMVSVRAGLGSCTDWHWSFPVICCKQ